MAKQWTEEEQTPLLNVIPSYRLKIKQMDVKEAKKTTMEVANDIHKNHPVLQNRTVRSIFERIPYLDNLLAGVFEKYNYAIKDQHLFSSLPRENNSKEPNLCNTRHTYNGALGGYLKK